jgi:tetratricopeptide (TPR) repeat protein
MSFGFGFNKQKVLSAAEKFVQQGKLQNAVSEYEKILKADPKDLTVLNTVGDLYARSGNNDKAVECFKSVGDAYAAQGFTVKAIAMYKKLSKLKSSLEGVLRLAELYTQQGLFNDARAQYLQVAEEFLRDGQLEQAVRIFQKTLEMDPENVAMRTRLAEVYVRLNKKEEALPIFSAAVESLRSKGQLSAAEEILQRMAALDPGNSQAMLLRGKNAFEAGDIAGAAQYLGKVPDLDSHPDGLKTLLQAYLETGKLAQAGPLAEKLLSVHNDVDAILSYGEALIAAGQFEDVLRVYHQHADQLFATNSAKVLESLHNMIGHVRENTVALEMVLELLNKSGENTHQAEIYELLAHGLVQSSQLEKARDCYLKLTQLEPENQLHAKNYQQVLGKLGDPSTNNLITAEEGAVMVDELEATAPFIDQRYEDEVALAVRAALTDAELFFSYNMPAKALGPLLSALPQAPRDLRINQRLAALHTRAGKFTEAAVCCRTLESIYHDAGNPEDATRYGELAAKYEERAAAVPYVPAPAAVLAPMTEPVAGIPVAPETPELSAEPEGVEPVVAELPVTPDPAVEAPAAPALFFHAAATPAPAAPPESDVPEISLNPPESKEFDVSGEWEDTFSEEPAAAPQEEAPEVAPAATLPAAADSQAVSEAVEEIRFYLTNGMTDEAHAAFAKLEQLNPAAYILDGIRDQIDAAAEQASQVEEIAVEPAEVPASMESDLAAEVAPEAQEVSAPEVEAAPASQPGALKEFVSDLEESLGEEFLPQTKSHEFTVPAPEPEPEAVEAAKAAPAASGAGNLNEFVSQLEESLGDDFKPAAPAVPEKPSVKTERPKWPSGPPKVIAPVPASVPAPVSVPAVAASAGPATAAAVAPALETPAATSPTFVYQPSKMRPLGGPAPAPTGTVDLAAGVDLADMFGELKHELEDEAAFIEEDPETHYNLGVAFREMGLLDEAIGELQKVCQAVDHGHPFPRIMQTCTWLAQCFLDKGMPDAAVRWYEKALKLEAIDEETRTALHYELASAYEAAGNKPAALQHFTQVYGSNIDYRDVTERMQTLKS